MNFMKGWSAALDKWIGLQLDSFNNLLVSPAGRAYDTPHTLLNASGGALALVGTTVYTEVMDREGYDSYMLALNVAAHSITVQPYYCDTPDGVFAPMTANTQATGFVIPGLTMTAGTRREITPMVTSVTAVVGYPVGHIGGRYVKFLITGTAGDPLTLLMTLASM